MNIAEVEFAWEGQEDGDLPLIEGARIELLSMEEPGEGWWTGRCLVSGRDGIFPANYVRPAPAAATATTATAVAAAAAGGAATTATAQGGHEDGDDKRSSAAAAEESPSMGSVLPKMTFIAEQQRTTGAPISRSSPQPPLPEGARRAMATAAGSLRQLRAVLDDHVVGQRQVKEGILLALMTREHIYLEGPPGVAKTFIAEITAQATALSSYVYQFHRDTKLSELVCVMH